MVEIGGSMCSGDMDMDLVSEEGVFREPVSE
jgi:hypothetical protein